MRFIEPIMVAVLSSFLFTCARPNGSSAPVAEVEHCKLLFWQDGDTAVVDCPSNHRTTVRLVGIDTPESGFDENSRNRGERQVKWWKIPLEKVFECGKRATKRARELCPKGSPVTLHGSESDRYGRRLAKIVCRGIDINERLVEEGLAGRYPYPNPPKRPRACGQGK